jgi:hypothetical protein
MKKFYIILLVIIIFAVGYGGTFLWILCVKQPLISITGLILSFLVGIPAIWWWHDHLTKTFEVKDKS